MATGAEAAVIGLMLAGTAASTAATVKASQNQQAQAEANAKAAELSGKDEQAAAVARAEAITREGRRIISRQRALLAESAVDPGTGTLAELQAETQEQARMDALAMIYGGRKARSSRRYEASGYRAEARGARTALPLQVGSSVLQGASKIASFQAERDLERRRRESEV